MSRKLMGLVLAALSGCGGRTGVGLSNIGEGEAEAEAVPEPDGAAPDGPADDGMVLIPAGAFRMGCNEAVDTECLSWEYPYHEVTLSAFRIDRTEVTVAAYATCVVAGVCRSPNIEPYYCTWSWTDHGLHPVNCVTWYDAQDYCAWVGKRLPTEAEWEKAARGVDGRKYPWGNDKPSCARASYMGCGDVADPVGSAPGGAGPYGVLDMAGNVDEWVADWYDPDYYASSPDRDPQGPANGTYRGWRGGGAGGDPSYLRTSSRFAHEPTYEFGAGFRCASDP